MTVCCPNTGAGERALPKGGAFTILAVVVVAAKPFEANSVAPLVERLLRISWCVVVFATVFAADSFISVVDSTLAYAVEKGSWRRTSNINKRQPTKHTKTMSSVAKAHLPPPGSARCEWGRSIINDYAFEKVEIKSCGGSTYVFEGTRKGKTFTILLNASSGELLKVEKLQIEVDPSIKSQFTRLREP